MMTWNSLFFNSPSTYLMEMVSVMHDHVSLFLFSILLLVLINMVYTTFCSYFSFEFFENHQIESVWTILPFMMLIFILIPSLSSLYSLDSCIFCGLSISVMGHQWYWSYHLKDLGNTMFDSYMTLPDSGNLRLLDVDNRLLIPNNFPVRFLVSSSDVIHSWTVPSFGLKMDAIPGRINQFCFSLKRSGIFFGQCSEICGMNHSFMPIVVESIPFKKFMNLF